MASSPPAPPESRARRLAPAALAFILVAASLALLHGYVLRWPFVSDDYVFLAGIQKGSLRNLYGAFEVVQNYFRPVGRELYFLALSRVAGFDPLVFHLFNFGVLLAVMGLVLAVCWQLAGPRVAVLACATYALLYTHRVLMGWVSCAQDLLAAAFGLGAVWFHVRGRGRLAAASFFIALLSKESVAALPLVLAAWGAWQASGRMGAREAAVTGLRRTLPLWVAAATWALVVVAVRAWRGAWMPGESAPVADVSLQIGSFWEGFRSAVLTYLGLDQPWASLRDAIGRAHIPWLAMVSSAGCGALAFLYPSKGASGEQGPGESRPGAWRLGLLWATLGAAPAALAGHHFSAYYASFAAVGFALILGELLARAPLPLATALLAVGAAASTVANEVDRFRVSLAAPDPPGVSFVTAARLTREVRFVNALHDALALSPPPRGAIVYLSNTPHLSSLATAGDRAPKVWFNDRALEVSYITQYSPGLEPRPRVFLRFDPDRWSFARLPEALVDAIVEGEDHLARHEPQQARAALEQALGLARRGVYDLERVELLNSLGVASWQSGDSAAARRAWLDALELAPRHSGALLNLTAMEAGAGRFAAARALVLRDLASHPDDPQAMFYLYRLERALGEPDAAQRVWERLAATHPRFADSLVKSGAVF
ncbi:MAG: hypothetical protein E6K73_02845 [Candidatus Eisenbacteria bacterium]|uniref:Uncharacterized protein n=1 Tax=Eiseniibacteriota bacterium TaxID=2212470 RepID=A0A538SM40_UNCEI|nr:MAG: hypothetical protein E6K73_02845 [Candidatus Eisenbacteria bacterium]